ncbi:hypothetical protein NC653_002082 [Populus alba x Populus x berolinensis]|uniref:RRM domain-containing protein n=1 Tax=Populus alba x Populus x berolinensis TaxID=444605 RepID=A0AAD6RPN9_9ROSI|nr:hypothetical protein NC653_002082 [Populus alba x Populus x berolinensis]
MTQVKTVFIDGLPASWDEDRVRVLLKKYGEIEKTELARNMPSARRKDFGFVTFDTHDAVVTFAKSINNAELGEGDNKAKVGLKSSTGLRERRPPVMSMPASSRPLASQSRSFERRPPPPAYAKSLKRGNMVVGVMSLLLQGADLL